MVGHSGKMEPTIRAVETVDRELGRIYNAIRQTGGSMLITADHGNAETMIDPVTGGPYTAHTTNPAIKQHGGSMLITADHGNAELLIDPATGGPHTAHT